MTEERLPTFLDPEFLAKLERLRLVAKRLSWSGAKGEHATPRRGSSLEFSDYRRYQRGDDLRYVDWNIYCRLEKLFLKLFTAEEEMNLYLLLDASRSMGEGSPPKIEYATGVAAALGYIGLKNLDRVGGATFATDLISPLSLGRGRKQILTMFSFLTHLSCGGETDLSAAAKSFVLRFPRQGMVVVLSDLFDPRGWRPGLEELVKGKYEVLVIHIVDEHEIQPRARGDVSLFDVEGGRERKLLVDAELARAYQEEVNGYFEEIHSFCVSRRIDYLRTTTAVPFDEFVLLTLRQSQSVR